MKGATFEPYEEGGAHVSIDTGNANTLRVRIRGKEAAMSALMTHDEARKMAHALISLTEKTDGFSIQDTMNGPWKISGGGLIFVDEESGDYDDFAVGFSVRGGGVICGFDIKDPLAARAFAQEIISRADKYAAIKESEDEQC